jgi:hypothetical protein
VHHKKTSYFISGVFLLLEFTLAVATSFNIKFWFISIFFWAFGCLEIYRLIRKYKFYSHHHTKAELTDRISYRQTPGLRHPAWHNFADATEQEYIADKFHDQIKKIRKG